MDANVSGFERMLTSQVKRDRDTFNRDAKALAEAAGRVGTDPASAIQLGRVKELADDAQQLLLLSIRLRERQDALDLYRADREATMQSKPEGSAS